MGRFSRFVALVVGLLLLPGCGTKDRPIERFEPARQSAAPTVSVASTDAPPPPSDALLVEVDASGQVRVDGRPVDETSGLDRMRRIDGLFSELKNRRQTWKSEHADEPFPGVVLLRVAPTLRMLVVKSVFQTVAFGGYPRILIQLVGAPASFDAEPQLPGPPAPDEVPPAPEKLLHLAFDRDGAELTWKRGLDVLSTSRLPTAALNPGICDAWRAEGEHVATTDPRSDVVVVRVENDLEAAALGPLLSAIEACRRKLPDGSTGRALTLQFSVR